MVEYGADRRDRKGGDAMLRAWIPEIRALMAGRYPPATGTRPDVPLRILSAAMLALCLTCIAGGCSLLEGQGDDCGLLFVAITAAGDSVSYTELVSLTVTAENRGRSRIVWGFGSSSCQLGAVVRVGALDRIAPGVRVCTEDLSEQGLDAGASRTETWFWDGRVLGENGLELLPPGQYEVYAVAGDCRSEAGVRIQMVQL